MTDDHIPIKKIRIIYTRQQYISLRNKQAIEDQFRLTMLQQWIFPIRKDSNFEQNQLLSTHDKSYL